jgi:hypothetical protein
MPWSRCCWDSASRAFVPALGYLRQGWRAPLAGVGLLAACLGCFDLLTGYGLRLGTTGNSNGAGACSASS